MDAPTTALAVIACLFSSALAGVLAHARLPSALLTRGSVDTLRRGIGIVALMAGLLLALMTVYLKVNFDTTGRNVQHFAAEVISLDQALRHAGPQAAPARALLFRYTARTMKDVWPLSTPNLGPDDVRASRLLRQLENAVLALHADEARAQGADAMARDALQGMIQTRWTLNEPADLLGSPWLMAILVFWLMLTFATLGLWAPRTPLVLGALFLCAVALGAAVFLAMEYAGPFDGIIVVSSEPMQSALFALSD